MTAQYQHTDLTGVGPVGVPAMARAQSCQESSALCLRRLGQKDGDYLESLIRICKPDESWLITFRPPAGSEWDSWSVLDADSRGVGYVVIQIRERDYLVRGLGFVQALRHPGSYRRVTAFLRDKASQDGGRSVSIMARERDLQTQVFLRSSGLKCTDILPRWYGEQDAYFFRSQ